MIIKSFKAKNVWDYLNFNIDFHSDITFLIGINGSGKSTALRMISALANFDTEYIHETKFDSASITFIDDKNKEYYLSIEKMDGQIRVKSNLTEKETFEIESNKEKEKTKELFTVDINSSFEIKMFNAYQNQKKRKEISRLSEKLKEVRPPFFLGIDRSHLSSPQKNHTNDKESEKFFKRNRLIEDIETAVKQEYKRIREHEENGLSKVRSKIISYALGMKKSTAEYQFNTDIFSEEKISEIEKTLKSLTGEDTSIFDYYKELISQLRPKHRLLQYKNSHKRQLQGIYFGTQINETETSETLNEQQIYDNINRFHTILSLVKEHNESVINHSKKLTKLIETINTFFGYGDDKTIDVDNIGQLFVKRKNGTISSIDSLSSGEKQLLLIFAKALLYDTQSKRNLFMIDEPELSLHIFWQAKLSDEIKNLLPNTQFIFATHSPEIIGNMKSKVVKCR
jgi:predicted ATPase